MAMPVNNNMKGFIDKKKSIRGQSANSSKRNGGIGANKSKRKEEEVIFLIIEISLFAGLLMPCLF